MNNKDAMKLKIIPIDSEHFKLFLNDTEIKGVTSFELSKFSTDRIFEAHIGIQVVLEGIFNGEQKKT